MSKDTSTLDKSIRIRIGNQQKTEFTQKLAQRDETQGQFIRRVIAAWIDGRLQIQE